MRTILNSLALMVVQNMIGRLQRNVIVRVQNGGFITEWDKTELVHALLMKQFDVFVYGQIRQEPAGLVGPQLIWSILSWMSYAKSDFTYIQVGKSY